MYQYEGTFSEHLEMFIQLGYVALFSSAFPMAALCALLNNLIEIRSDAFKLCFVYQRPFIQRVANIGMWQNVMEVMSLIAVLVNCALIGLSGQVHRMFPDMSKIQTILLIVALEHIMLVIRFLITCLIPDLPDWVATEMAKMEFARREAMNHMTPLTVTPPETVNDNKSTTSGISIGRFVVSTSDSGQNEEVECNRADVENCENCADVENCENCARLNNDDNITVHVPVPVPINSDDMEVTETGTLQKEKVGGNARQSSVFTTIPEPDITVSTLRHLKSAQVLSLQAANDWSTSTESHLDHHATINAQTGVTWHRNLKHSNTQKLLRNIEKNVGTCRSTSCIPFGHKDSVSSSDSSLPKSPLIATTSKDGYPFASSNMKDSTGSETSSETGFLTDPTEKKQKLKQSLIKRARSVAMFSLKLKERRAKAMKEEEKPKEVEKPAPPNVVVGGELSCIPIEMLIALDDINLKRPKTIPPSSALKPGSKVKTQTSSSHSRPQ